MGDATTLRAFARATNNDLLWHAVLSYIFAAIQNGDLALLRMIGISDEQMQRMSSMSVYDLRHALQRIDAVVQLRIDGDRLDEMMQTIERQRRRAQLAERCIRLDAPLAMMERCFGMRAKEYRSLQHRYGVSGRPGRPPRSRPEIAERIYRTWEARGGRLTAGALVRIAEETGVPLSIVWREIIGHPQLQEAQKASQRNGVPPARTLAADEARP